MESNILSDLKLLRCLGNGGYGIVFHVIDTHTNNAFALKLQLDQTNNAREQSRLVRESATMAPLEPHPNLVQILGSSTVDLTHKKLNKLVPAKLLLSERQQLCFDTFKSRAKRLGIISVFAVKMELCGKDLREWLNIYSMKPALSIDPTIKRSQVQILRDIVEGLKHLHTNKIIHRDLKPENIMFSNVLPMNGFGFPVKLGDFGLCRNIHSPESMTSSMTTQVGTMTYMAPEVRMRGKEYRYESDIFSLGLVAWEVATLMEKEKRSVNFDELVFDGEEVKVQYISHIPSLRNAILKATKQKPEDRMTSIHDFLVECSPWFEMQTDSTIVRQFERRWEFCEDMDDKLFLTVPSGAESWLKATLQIDFRNGVCGKLGTRYNGVIPGTGTRISAWFVESDKAKTLPNLQSVIEILRSIGTHVNIVSSFAEYTGFLGSGHALIVTEFCSMGSLKEYLKCIDNAQRGSLTESLKTGNTNTTFCQLLMWSHQIASGMEYIAERGIVLVNLLCKNVLLSHDETAKISNFRLSHYSYSNLRDLDYALLPTLWMAIESLEELEFSSKTDVWTFGILLYEIFSLGKDPFAKRINNAEFVNDVRSGMRLPLPKFATPEIYAWQLKCWRNDPMARPLFGNLVKAFYQMVLQVGPETSGAI